MEGVFGEDLGELFKAHLRVCLSRLAHFLHDKNYQGVVIDSGVPYEYFKDDQTAPFRSNPYFNYFCPLEGEKHLLFVKSDGSYELFIYEPKSFWSDIKYDVAETHWHSFFKISFMRSEKERQELLRNKKSWAFVGREFKGIDEFKFVLNPEFLLSALDWWRAQKSDYEIFCLDQANKKAASAHTRIKELFLKSNPSELVLHEEYLKALQETEGALPYHSIIAHNEKAAILHYQYKRAKSVGDVLLIDSGASFFSYASDITRTHIRKQSCHPVFVDLFLGVEQLQQSLCDQVTEGASFVDLQMKMHRGLANLLIDQKILLSLSSEDSVDLGLTANFCPHGLGHMLGLQVHDVGGGQQDEKGTPCERDPKLPKVRMSRKLRQREVVTIEPGLYFIPFLLESQRGGEHRKYFNWSLLDELIPFGGIRIEDDVVVQKNSKPLNLTRQYLL